MNSFEKESNVLISGEVEDYFIPHLSHGSTPVTMTYILKQIFLRTY